MGQRPPTPTAQSNCHYTLKTKMRGRRVSFAPPLPSILLSLLFPPPSPVWPAKVFAVAFPLMLAPP